MFAESTQGYKALQVQAVRLEKIFDEAGYEIVAPSIIQPAGIFLDQIGEALRSRTYVFEDPEGNELCLRPDLTMPVSRVYYERHIVGQEEGGIIAARYSYNGSAFRYYTGGATADHPCEFRQAGIERFGDANREEVDSEILAMALKVLQETGVGNIRIRMGDLGLFNALLEAIDMPQHWRNRLGHHFWRHDSFRSVLQHFSKPPEREIQEQRRKLLLRLDPEQPEMALDVVDSFLKENSIPLIGLRTLQDITQRLLEQASDLQEKPLSAQNVKLITDYLNVRALPRAAAMRMEDLAEQAGVNIGSALNVFNQRLEFMAKAGVDLNTIEFSAEFGREVEYYTGFVFQLDAPDLPNGCNIAGGGRYDNLLTHLGSKTPIPAVGCAFHTERLLRAVSGGDYEG